MVHYAQKQNLFPMQGGCPCARIRYEVTLPFLLVHCCSCTSCQREVGSAFALNAVIESSAVNLLPSVAPFSPGSKIDAATTACGALPAFAQLTNSNLCSPAATSPESKELAKPVLVTIPSGSGAGQTIAQCPVCRFALWSSYADAGTDIFYLRVGTLDHSYEIDPDVHTFTRSRRDFVTITDGKPQFEAYYEDRSALYRPETKDRVDALNAKQAVFRQRFKAALAAAADNTTE